VCAAIGGKASACAAGGTSIGAGRARPSLGHIAAVEEFALQNFPQTRANSDGLKATLCTARLVPNFHHKHVQPPLTGFCGLQLIASLFTLIQAILSKTHECKNA
jgi:hypothetical protein